MDFHGSRTPTVGVECELQLLDINSLDLVDGIIPLLELCPDTDNITPEYIQYTVEVNSKVCQNIEELEGHLRERLRMLHGAARDLGMTLAAAGTHPFCDRPGVVTPLPRYHRVEKDTGFAGATQLAFAIHVHVAMADAEQAIDVMNRMRPYLAVLLALSASSPYWWGYDTGFASYRPRVLSAAHAFGTPPYFATWADFEQLFETSTKAGVFEGLGDMHWDIRPRPDFGTLEVRVMDAQPTVRDTVALAAVVRALAEYLKQSAPEDSLPELPTWLEQENHYRAAHLGLEADYVAGISGRIRPMREVAEEMLAMIEPTAEDLGERAHLDQARRIARRGPYYRREREVFRKTESLQEVTRDLVTALEQDLGVRGLA